MYDSGRKSEAPMTIRTKRERRAELKTRLAKDFGIEEDQVLQHPHARTAFLGELLRNEIMTREQVLNDTELECSARELGIAEHAAPPSANATEAKSPDAPKCTGADLYEKLVEHAAGACGTSPLDIRSTSRKPRTGRARLLIVFIAVNYLRLSDVAIAAIINAGVASLRRYVRLAEHENDERFFKEVTAICDALHIERL